MIHPRDWYVDINGQGPDLLLLHGLGPPAFPGATTGRASPATSG